MTTATTKPRSSPASVGATGPRVAQATRPVTIDQVRARAYEIYQSRTRNGGGGDETSDWLQAEHELGRRTAEFAASINTELKSRARGEALLAGGE